MTSYKEVSLKTRKEVIKDAIGEMTVRYGIYPEEKKTTSMSMRFSRWQNKGKPNFSYHSGLAPSL